MNKEQYRDFAYSKLSELKDAIMKKVGDRNIIFYGAGNGALWLGKILTPDIVHKKVFAIIDTSENIQGKCLFEKQIQSPDILCNLDMNRYVILISAINYSEEIANMLREVYHLKQGIHFLNYTHLYWQYYFFHSDLDRTLAIYDFIDRAVMTDIPVVEQEKNKEEIGIVINYSLPNGISHAAYTIALYFLLRCRGYRVRLILEDLCDTSYYPMFHENLAPHLFDDLPVSKMTRPIMYIAFDAVISYLEDTLEDIKCDRISKVVPVKRLSACDMKYIDSYAEQSYLANLFYKLNIAKAPYKIHCKKMAEYVAAYLERLPVTSMILYNGMSSGAGIFTYFGQKNSIRTPSYDGKYERGKGKIFLSADRCCCHHFDCAKVIYKHLFSETEIKKIIELGKGVFQFRINAHATAEERKNFVTEYAYVSYQPVKTEYYGQYDIVMPLNLPADSAAIGIPGIFSSMWDWMLETLDYILTHTAATVLVRMHPVQGQLEAANIFGAQKIGMTVVPITRAYDEEILKRYGNHPRLRFVRGNEPCNTYEVVRECKLLLPYNSTIGIEAAILGKTVLVSQDNYYARLGFVQRAITKEDYFQKISQSLSNKSKPLSQNSLNNAYIALACITHAAFQTDFVPDVVLQDNLQQALLPWQHLTIEELMQLDGVKEIMNIFAENKPSCVLKMRKVLESMKEKA